MVNPTPGHFTPEKETRYPLHRRLGETQRRSKQGRKISTPPAVRSPDRPDRNKSLKRLWISFLTFGSRCFILSDLQFWDWCLKFVFWETTSRRYMSRICRNLGLRRQGHPSRCASPKLRQHTPPKRRYSSVYTAWNFIHFCLHRKEIMNHLLSEFHPNHMSTGFLVLCCNVTVLTEQPHREK